MNLLAKTALPQFLNKNTTIRAICSGAFNTVSGSHSNRIDGASSRRLSLCSRCQQKVLLSLPTALHNRSLPQMVSYRTISSNGITASRINSPETFLDKFQRLIGLHKDSKTGIRRSAYLLYETVSDNIDYPKFVRHFQLENSFNSWFLITELHVWMLMVRAMASEKNGQFIRNNIVEAMWSDIQLRTKKLGQSNRGLVRKQINELADQFEYTLIAYDEGLSANDKQLASALWKQFFNSNCDDYEKIELLVKYVRANIARLDRLPQDEFLHQRKIKWTDLNES